MVGRIRRYGARGGACRTDSCMGMHDDVDNDDPSHLGSKSWQVEHSIISATLTASIGSSYLLSLLRPSKHTHESTKDILDTRLRTIYILLYEFKMSKMVIWSILSILSSRLIFVQMSILNYSSTYWAIFGLFWSICGMWTNFWSIFNSYLVHFGQPKKYCIFYTITRIASSDRCSKSKQVKDSECLWRDLECLWIREAGELLSHISPKSCCRHQNQWKAYFPLFGPRLR